MGGRNTFRDDAAGGVGPDVDHLGAGVGLLMFRRQCHRIELADRTITLQDHTRVLPRDSRTGLNLGPRNLCVGVGPASFGDEVVDAADPVLITGIPVLHSRVLDLGSVFRHELNDRGVELVFVALGSSAPFEVGDMGVVLGHDERAFELTGVHRVDAEVRREFHGAANTLGDVAERPVGEYRRVERSKKVVSNRHDRPQMLLDELRMILHRLGERTKNDTSLSQGCLERGHHRDRIDNGINSDVAEHLLLMQRDAELVEHLADVGIDIVHAVEDRLLLRGCPIADRLIVDWSDLKLGPVGLFHLLPRRERLQTPLQQPLRLVLLRRDQTHGLLAQPWRCDVGIEIGTEAKFVVGFGQFRCRRVAESDRRFGVFFGRCHCDGLLHLISAGRSIQATSSLTSGRGTSRRPR